MRRGIWHALGVVIVIIAGQMPVARAIDLETLVMPGPVIADHADTESECSACHVAFSRERQRTLCLDCHEDVGADIKAGTGFHGLDASARDDKCASCHTEHEGRDADVIGLDEKKFDHTSTDFILLDAHLEVECVDCHEPPAKYREAPSTCYACHQEDDEHRGGLGEDCADCHKPTEWKETRFDHTAETGYALLGGHADVSCVSCHVDHQYKDTSTDCYSCHRDDDEHEGLNGTDCAFCHVVRTWTELKFDHQEQTGFALLGQHGEIACADCHTGNKFEIALESECVSCHLDDDEHEGRNGPDCGDCHNTIDWAESQFDHERETGFALLGKHGEIVCADCHTGPVNEVKLEAECISCHRDDDQHEGEQGEACGDCHNEQGWAVAVRFDHDFTRFPLVGLHQEAVCDDCHASKRFREAPELCVDCHLEDDVHEATLGPACADCHNPGGWPFWVFDHNTRTNFILDGAHDGLACKACHTEPVKDQFQMANTCAGCHRQDDIHRGEFGADCARCHNTRSFTGATRRL
jgi:hypothetical protein